MNSRSRKFLSILNILFYIGMVAVNATAVILPLNNRTTAELSDKYPNLFVPAGLTFSIWGVIYLLLLIFCIYQAYAAFSSSKENSVISKKTGITFILSCILNGGWIFAWHYERVLLSLVIMALLLITLIILYLRLDISSGKAGNAEKYFAHLPFSIYLGWITVATIANASAYLVSVKWNTFGLGNVFWTIVMISAAVVIGLISIFSRRDIFFSLVIDWALLGIMIKTFASAPQETAVLLTLGGGMTLITLSIILQIIRRKVYA